MKRFITTVLSFVFILMTFTSDAQLTIEFSTAQAISNKIELAHNVITGDYETQAYNPFNMGVKYRWGRWKMGMDIAWMEYINNFNGLEVDRFDLDERSEFSWYVNGGYDRSQLASMVTCSYSFFEEQFLSVGLGIGIGHNFSNHIRSMTLRDIYQDDQITAIKTYELDGEKGYSASAAYQLALRLSSPQSWPVSLFIEANYQGYTPLWEASRLSMPEDTSRLTRQPLPFSHHTLFLRFGFWFSLEPASNAKVEAGNATP